MNKRENANESLELIEEFGLFLEKSGYIPSAARVYALLMIWDTSELHFDEIQEILKLSKGATSKAVNNLIDMSRIEIFTKNGVRKKFYRVKTKPGKESTKSFVIYIETMKNYLEKIEKFKKERNSEGLRFDEEIDFFTDLIQLLRKTL